MRTPLQIVFAVALLTACAYAQPPEGPGKPPPDKRQERGEGPEGGMEGFIHRLAEDGGLALEIGLSEEQRAGLHDELYALRMKMIDLRADLEKAGIEQARLLMAPEIDEKAVMAVVDKAGAVRTEMARLRVRHVILLRKTLTAEQIEKAKGLLRKRQEMRRKEWGGDRPGEQGDRARRREWWKPEGPMQNRDVPPPEEGGTGE